MDDEAYETGAAIGVVPVTGGEPRFITDFAQFGYRADWGPTGQIVYSVQMLELQRTVPPSQDTWDLFAIRGDGSGARQITHVTPGTRLGGPTWAPDGRAITAWDRTSGGPVTIDPTTGEVEAFGLPGLEGVPVLRPLP
jgi:hypothetical protein